MCTTTTLANLLGQDSSVPTTTLAQLCQLDDTATSQPLCGETAYETQLSQLGGPGFGYGGTTFAQLLAALPPSVLDQILLGDVLTGLLNRADYPGRTSIWPTRRWNATPTTVGWLPPGRHHGDRRSGGGQPGLTLRVVSSISRALRC